MHCCCSPPVSPALHTRTHTVLLLQIFLFFLRDCLRSVVPCASLPQVGPTGAARQVVSSSATSTGAATRGRLPAAVFTRNVFTESLIFHISHAVTSTCISALTVLSTTVHVTSISLTLSPLNILTRLMSPPKIQKGTSSS